MKYQLLSALVFLAVVTRTNTMEEKPKKAKNQTKFIIKIRSLSEGSMSLENLKQQADSPRISPKTDEVIQAQEKKNALPPRVYSPRLATEKAINDVISSSSDNEVGIMIQENK